MRTIRRYDRACAFLGRAATYLIAAPPRRARLLSPACRPRHYGADDHTHRAVDLRDNASSS
jgi:hypothetical protein